MKSHLLLLCRYNVWANQRIAKFLMEAGDKIADQELVSSFPTIRKTLYHIWDAQVIWHSRLQGESPNSWPSHHFSGSLQEALDALLENSHAFVRYCENLPENGEEQTIEFKSLDGTSYFNTAAEIIMHVMNHGTFHRGQLITMLRNAGFTGVTSTDLIRYYREEKK
jgi:uncharacterized damage-inducible protein DinB